MIDKNVILQAIARGWCAPKNANKVMDEELAFAISDEVVLALAATSTEPAAEPTMASAREMAIAQAVRQACNSCYSPDDTASDLSDKVGDLDLAGIIASIGASPAPSAKQEPPSLPNQALALVNLLQRWASWIVRERPKNLLDHACARCVPHSDMLVDGFSCVYHEAIDTIGGSIPLAATSASASPAAPQEPIHCQEFHELAMDYRGASTMHAHRAYTALCSYIEGKLAAAASPAAAVAAPAPAPVAGSQHVVTRIIRDVCELDEEGDDQAMDVLTVTVDALRVILERNLVDFAAAAPAVPVPAEQAWQPMETAPKDGREVLLQVAFRAGIPGKQLVGHFMEGGHCIEDHPAIARGWYFWNGCFFDEAAKPTHWMPIPAAPSLQQPKTGSQP